MRTSIGGVVRIASVGEQRDDALDVDRGPGLLDAAHQRRLDLG
jgi:hypothetical protein